jgi:hypothetical protein
VIFVGFSSVDESLGQPVMVVMFQSGGLREHSSQQQRLIISQFLNEQLCYGCVIRFLVVHLPDNKEADHEW